MPQLRGAAFFERMAAKAKQTMLKCEADKPNGGDSVRCSCPTCGAYMVQDEKGLYSRCICPECFAVCSACMGTQQAPMDPDQLKFMLVQREMYDDTYDPED